MIVCLWGADILMSKKVFASLISMVLWLCLPVLPVCADIKLPPPQQKGGAGIFDVLKKRSSSPGGDFSVSEIDQVQLSNILWAASGLNRGDTGWTIPGVDGLSPYVRIYVANNDGVFLYQWQDHSLKEISPVNIKAGIGKQSFVRRLPQILIFVLDLKNLASFDGEQAKEFAHIQVGAMTQNIYLAAAAMQLGARYIHRIDKEAVISALKLDDYQVPVALMLLGK